MLNFLSDVLLRKFSCRAGKILDSGVLEATTALVQATTQTTPFTFLSTPTTMKASEPPKTSPAQATVVTIPSTSSSYSSTTPTPPATTAKPTDAPTANLIETISQASLKTSVAEVTVSTNLNLSINASSESIKTGK